jgi:phenylalanyl-tRNA synthetase alpha chain
MPTYITPAQLRQALCMRDLSDPAAGAHCMQQLVAAAIARLCERWGSDLLVHRGERVVSVADNYDLLGYPPDGPARDARYTRYVSDGHLLRTQTSAAVPGALRLLALTEPRDTLVACPGLVYRRDVIDARHTGEPHQLDLWRVTAAPMAREDLLEMIATVVEALISDAPWRARPAEHPYTIDGLEVEVLLDGEWVELLECGLAHPRVLARAGLGELRGLAMGLGLDRAVMLRKRVLDIRLLRSADPRVASQMLDLEPYRPVSAQPPAPRDISVCCAPGLEDEQLGDVVRSSLGTERSEWVEEVKVLSRTPVGELPAAARARMGCAEGQENLLVRVLLRHPTRSLSKTEANLLRDRIYAALHEGAAHEWTTRGAPERSTPARRRRPAPARASATPPTARAQTKSLAPPGTRGFLPADRRTR